jgi:single-strand DNA-binding protein
MIYSLNKTTLIGNVGKTPESRTTSSGNKVVYFTMATSESWKNKTSNEYESRTEWHRIVIFNELFCDVAQNHIKKGDRIYIEGKLQTRTWIDNTGAEKKVTEIILPRFGGNLLLLGNKSNEKEYVKKETPADYEYKLPPLGEMDDEIPF